MEKYFFELTPADRKCTLDFTSAEISEMFRTAITNCNEGVTFSRSKKRIEILSISPKEIQLVLENNDFTPLPSPTRSLSAFSRELVRLDGLNKQSLLSTLQYNHTLFHTKLKEVIKPETKTSEQISDVELSKFVIDILFSSDSTYNTSKKNKAILDMKKIMLEFIVDD